jgi:hypothetical protein
MFHRTAQPQDDGTAPADGPKGWTDGSAHDLDRVAGNADRPRPRRAPARRLATLADPIPDRPLALTGRPRRPGTESPPGDRESPSLLSTADLLNEATPTSSFRRRFVMSGPGGHPRTSPGPPSAVHTSFGVARAPSLVGGPGRDAGAGSARTNARSSHTSSHDNRRTTEEQSKSVAAAKRPASRCPDGPVVRLSGARWRPGTGPARDLSRRRSCARPRPAPAGRRSRRTAARTRASAD